MYMIKNHCLETLPLENWDSTNSSESIRLRSEYRASYPSKFTGRETSNLR